MAEIEQIPEKIAVYVPDAEAAKFLLFQQYYVPFEILVQAHVFDERDSTILIDFDHAGTIVKVRRNDVLFKAERNR